MAPLEIRCDSSKLADIIRDKNARTIAVDGCAGAGKTFLAEQLGNILNLSVLDFDSFLNKSRGSFIRDLKIDELVRAIQRDLAGESVVLSGLFMLEVLKKITFNVDIVVYVKLYSKYNIPKNLHILRCEDEDNYQPRKEILTDLDRQLCEYHRRFKPSRHADMIFIRTER
jgi:hypothetical protein